MLAQQLAEAEEQFVGICGAITVYGNAWLIPKIGVGLFAMLLLIGQLLLSLLMLSGVVLIRL